MVGSNISRVQIIKPFSAAFCSFFLDKMNENAANSSVVCTVKARIPTLKSNFNLFYYKSSNNFHLAIVFNKNYSDSLNKQKNYLNGGCDGEGERVGTCLVRIHSCCLTGEILLSRRCDCGEQLETSLRLLEESGGILIYLNQVGQPTNHEVVGCEEANSCRGAQCHRPRR